MPAEDRCSEEGHLGRGNSLSHRRHRAHPTRAGSRECPDQPGLGGQEGGPVWRSQTPREGAEQSSVAWAGLPWRPHPEHHTGGHGHPPSRRAPGAEPSRTLSILREGPLKHPTRSIFPDPRAPRGHLTAGGCICWSFLQLSCCGGLITHLSGPSMGKAPRPPFMNCKVRAAPLKQIPFSLRRLCFSGARLPLLASPLQTQAEDHARAIPPSFQLLRYPRPVQGCKVLCRKVWELRAGPTAVRQGVPRNRKGWR